MNTVFVLFYNDPPNPLQILGVFDNSADAGRAKEKAFNDLQSKYKEKMDKAYEALKADKAEGYNIRVTMLRTMEHERVLEYGKAMQIVEVPYNDHIKIEKLPDFL